MIRWRIRGYTPLLALAFPAACSIVGCSGSDEQTASGPPPPVVNLVTDTNRDGALQLGIEDETNEEIWSSGSGAVFLVNVDDDDGDKVADNADDVVNGPDDEQDLARFGIQAWSKAPNEASATLAMDDVSRPFVRVFRQTGEGWTVVDFTTALSLDAAELRSNTVFAIEGLDFVRKSDQAWQGLVTFTLTVGDGKKTIGTDVAQMRAAPWLINHNLRSYDRVYYSEFSPRFTGTFPDPLDEVGITRETYPDNYKDGWADIWYEDWFQTGWTAMPAIGGNGDVHGMVILNPRPWGREPGKEPVKFLRERLLGPDRGVAVFWNEQTELDKGTTYDSHGNHEALPPYPAARDGRILHGSNVLQSTRDFYAAQLVQPPIEIETSWLIVGHVDEVYASVRAATPNGFKLLENSPALCKQLFSGWEGQGNGDAVVFQGLVDFDQKQWQTSVAKINADPVMMGWNQEAQTHIDVMRDKIIAEAGLTDDDFVPIPVLYEEIDGGKIAYLPDSANIRVVDRGNMAIMAQTFGPIINGKDAMRTYHETHLGGAEFKLGESGQGLKVRFADSWDYHVLLGDVHCASNWSSLPATEESSWWEALP